MEAEEEKVQEIYTLMNDKLKEVIRKHLVNHKEEVNREFMIEAAKILVSGLHFDPVQAAERALRGSKYDDAEYNDDEDADDELMPLLAPMSKKKHIVFDNYDCAVCGSRMRLRSKARHERTLKHKQATEVWTTRFEMK
jgi:hypothetical protein